MARFHEPKRSPYNGRELKQSEKSADYDPDT